MTDSASGPRPRRLTARGAATKARIIEAADQLMYERGVASTTLADVRASSGTSKSQLYQHFAEKDALVKEVIEARAEALLSQQRRRLTRVESLRGLELWRDELVERNGLRNGAFGAHSERWRMRSLIMTKTHERSLLLILTSGSTLDRRD